MPSIMDCSGPNLKCWIAPCPFSSITQKGLTIHLMQVHNMLYRDTIRPVKGARSRRKHTPVREALPENWSRPYGCAVCGNFSSSNKDELHRHVHQVHGGVAHQGYRDRHMHYQAAGNSGTVRNQTHARRESPYWNRCQQPQYCNGPVRQQQEKHLYDSYYPVNQTPMRAGDFQGQAATIVHEPVSQAEQYDRSQAYDAQRVATEWSQYRSSVQTPQAMSAEFASTIQTVDGEAANGWNPQINTERADDGNIQLWSGVDHMQSLEYDPKKDSINIAEIVNDTVQPCPHCGCGSRGGCTEKAVPDTQSDVNRIILVEEDGLGGTSNGGNSHEVYHLQGGTSFGNLKASNVKQVLSQGDEIVLEYHTEDGREVLLRAVRAEPDTEETIETNMEEDGLTLALASSSIDEETIKDETEVPESTNFDADAPLDENEAEPSESSLQPTEDSMQSTLPELFPELFEDSLVSSESSIDSVTWQTEEGEESGIFVEVCRKTDYLAALSHCRGIKVDSGLMLLKCGQCPYYTDMSDPLEQLQIHIRKHVETTFQCRNCEFSCSLREEMLVHAGTRHVVIRSQASY